MNLIQIGEAAQKYNISRRSLRYWEEKGILKSLRLENGYRVYDEENEKKIKRIIVLKELELRIEDIYAIFLSNKKDTVIKILENHLENIRHKAKNMSALSFVVEALIDKIKYEGINMFALLDMQKKNAEGLKAALSDLSERNDNMKEYSLQNEIRIVNLPKMTFACYRAESETPEDDCTSVMGKFIGENSIQEKEGFRHFGFNNPNPTEGNPVYGYEMWAVVPSGFDVPPPLWKKNFNGGLFASLTCTLANIGERWGELYSWVTESQKYDLDYNEGKDRIGLEENINYSAFNSPETGPAEMQLDLLMPIKTK